MTAPLDPDSFHGVDPNQRRFPRKSLTVDFSASDGHGQGQLIFQGADLSGGGAFLKSDLLLEQDELLTLEFKIPGAAEALRAEGRVAWVRRFPQESEPAGMGVAFVAMTDEHRALLDQYLGGPAKAS